MDYHSIHGRDISSFGIPDTHRLPTVAASQALDSLKREPVTSLTTGIDRLDSALGSASHDFTENSTHCGGIKRGQVTEVWGPPGTGKSALAIQIAAHAICDNQDVVWIDCFQKVQGQRVAQVIQAVKQSRDQSGCDHVSTTDWRKFTHFSCLTLPHLMALISRPTPKAISEGTSLVVLSSISALINSALPKAKDAQAEPKAAKGLSVSGKRRQGLQFIMNALQKLAATRNCAVVILSQCATKMLSEQGATLVAAVNASVWEQGITTRLVLFRDWAWQAKSLRSLFMVGLQKLEGKTTNDAVLGVAAFTVGQNGVTETEYDPSSSPSAEPADLARRKRKLGQAGLEVPDSEDDEDYGWADEDEAAMPAPPPQWQGSEDILLGQEVGRSDDGSDEGSGEDPDQATG